MRFRRKKVPSETVPVEENRDTTNVRKRRKPILSIISTILGGVSLLPFLGMASLAGVPVGVIGYIRERHVTAIIGTVLSIAGIATSPIVWALLLSIWLRVYCMVADCAERVSEVLASPKVQVQIGEHLKNLKPTKPVGTGASYIVRFPPAWQSQAFDKKGQMTPPSIHYKLDVFDTPYVTIPNSNAVMLYALEEKEPAEPITPFIDRFIRETLRPDNPNLAITPMQSVKINNSKDATLNVAHMRLLTGTRLGNEEVVSYIDGVEYVLIIVLAAPTHDDLAAVWPQFSDILVNNVLFSVKTPENKPPNPPVSLDTQGI